MSYLLHGSTAHTGMGWVDLVPRTNAQLYIGGLYALYQTDLIQAAGTNVRLNGKRNYYTSMNPFPYT
jgi:hypothetical protein